jgi:hypothetical protein
MVASEADNIAHTSLRMARRQDRSEVRLGLRRAIDSAVERLAPYEQQAEAGRRPGASTMSASSSRSHSTATTRNVPPTIG